MPPWLDWLDWLKWDCIGAGVLGKVLGVWFSFCISIFRKLFRGVPHIATRSARHGLPISRRREPSQIASSLGGKLIKIAGSTLVTLAMWVVITWKPVWLAAGAKGDRLLSVVLICISAIWSISLLWILFSKPQHKNILGTVQVHRPR
jgi:hypothetical protein